MGPPELSSLPTGEPWDMEIEPEPPASVHRWDGTWPQTQDEFESLVDTYLDRLVRYAFRRVASFQDAEDVVQEVLARAFAGRSRRKRASPVIPYLYRSVANACTDLLRKRKNPAALREGTTAKEPSGRAEDPSEIAQAADELRRAEQLLSRLPEAQAEVIRLRVFDELPLAEIAGVAGCSVNTVCSRLRYGFRKLRNLVSEKQG